MSLQNPISDLIIRIKNAQLINKLNVNIPSSNFKLAIVKILYQEGYIKNYYLSFNNKHKKYIKIKLKYYNNKPVIEEINQISKPSLKVYKPSNKLPLIRNGLGTLIVSTNKGVLTGKMAKLLNLGGELICYII